jgi:RHS repeat-associated protein
MGPWDFAPRTDESTGLIYARFRWLDPVLARFITPDAIDLRNRNYRYAKNCPVNYVDVDGLQPGQPQGNWFTNAVKGGAVWLSDWLISTGESRLAYGQEAKLAKSKAERTALQKKYYPSEPIARAMVDRMKADPTRVAKAKARTEGAVGNPTKTNTNVNAAAMKWVNAGWFLRALAILDSIRNVEAAEDKCKAVSVKAGGWTGALGGGRWERGFGGRNDAGPGHNGG